MSASLITEEWSIVLIAATSQRIPATRTRRITWNAGAERKEFLNKQAALEIISTEMYKQKLLSIPYYDVLTDTYISESDKEKVTEYFNKIKSM